MRACCSCAVHPRTRGEHQLNPLDDPAYTGSSPHARGTLALIQWAHEEKRFIPARAGNTCWISLRSRSSSVHPRTRGEHSESTM